MAKKFNSLEDEIFLYLATHSLCTLCTVDEDGFPRGGAMEFWLNKPYIYMMAFEGRKLENIRREPRVCLVVYDPFEADFSCLKGVQVFGKAEIIPHGSEKYAEQFEHKGYFGIDPKTNPRYRNLIRVTPDRMDFINAATPKDIIKTKRIWRREK